MENPQGFFEPPTPAASGMLCPHCRVPLAMFERQNIEIDYCPQCRGVWLDKGELDKIIQRSEAIEHQAHMAQPPAHAPQPAPQVIQQPVVAPPVVTYAAPVYQPQPRSFWADIFDLGHHHHHGHHG